MTAISKDKQRQHKTAFLVGSSGLVGSYLLQYLSDSENYDRVISCVRNASGNNMPKVEERVCSFDLIEQWEIPENAFVFCCLGTTIHKAGSKDLFRKIDRDYVIALARRALECKADFFAVVSSVGADPMSRNFYLRTKGEMEAALKLSGLPAVYVFRPSMLMGKRSEFRFGESIGKIFMQLTSFLFVGGLKQYKGIHASRVAGCMLKTAGKFDTGFHIVRSDQMQDRDF